MKKSCLACLLLFAAGSMAMAQAVLPADPFAGIDADELSLEEMEAVDGAREVYDAVDTALSSPRTTKPIPGATPSSGTGKRARFTTPGGVPKEDHKGTDYPAQAGTPVLAAKDGKVVFVERTKQFGGVVTVANADGTSSRYMHVLPSISIGARVRSGDEIAVVGIAKVENSGGTMSTGDHLHYEEKAPGDRIIQTRVVEKY